MKWLLLLVAFVLGGGLTYVLTVHRATREVPEEAPEEALDEQSEDASGFGGPPSAQSSGTAGGRWRTDAEDEDALLGRDASGSPTPADADGDDTPRGTPVAD